jgi:ATP-binding cassette subfamily B protein
MRGSDLLLVFWALRLPGSADRLAGLARQYPAARNTLLRQMEPLNAPEEARASLAAMVPKGAATVSITKGSVVAGGHAILRDIELMIAPGEHVAIVGRSGAGKSSLLGLLLGWHQLAAGELRVDGTELAGDTLVALRQRTAWVDPQVQIWNRSLLDNLIYATDDESLVKARLLVEASGLLDITSRLPQGLQTPLGEGGGLLSGGEAQRVRLGRAMMTAAPRLVLLDEPFRGLDRGQRHAMLASARAWWSKTTLLCVTHDIEETLNFDRVLVIEDGLIVEDGNPAQLITGATRYRALREAEAAVHRDMWQATPWRRINIAAGSVTELTVA